MTTDGPTAELNPTVEEILKHLDDGNGHLIDSFARAYLRRVSPRELATLGPAAFAAHIRTVFAFADARPRDEMTVRVFTPTADATGYDAQGSVVEVAAPDMAFLVDSVTNEIEAQGHSISSVFHPVIGTARDGGGRITEVLPARTARLRESIQHYQLTDFLDADEQDALQRGIDRALLDVRRAVGDFEQMQGAIYRMIKVARAGSVRYEKEEVEEAVAFLEWLLDDNFVFLGYREYTLFDEGGERMLAVEPHSGLGILSADENSAYAAPVPFSELRPDLQARYEGGDLLVITKTNSPSRVHRRAKMDYIGVRHIGPDGTVVGEARLLGLFTTKAYMAPAESIPVLHRKLVGLIEAEDLIEGSHFYKEVVQLFNTFPMDELFATPTEGIRENIVGLIHLQESQGIRLFVRRDLLQRNVSVLVVMPRDRFNATLRKELQDMFLERFGGSSIDYRLALGETDTARLHFTVWVTAGQFRDVSIQELESDVVAAAQTWEERLGEHLVDRFGPEIGGAYIEEWAGRFPDYYRSSTPLDIAVSDVAKLDEMIQDIHGRAVVGLQNEDDDGESLTRLAVYRADGKLELSAIMPNLEALGLRVIEEIPTRMHGGNREIFIHAFGVLDGQGRTLDIDEVGDRVAETVVAVLSDNAESDSLNRLIITAGLNHHEVRILRAYRTYWQRVSPGFTVAYVNDTFARHPGIAADLVALFDARFNPDTDEAAAPVADRIALALDSVASLDEDRILRGFLGLITATQRTNAYRNGHERLSFKFASAQVPDMPRPAPLFEIFVYADEVEGIHLRGGSVARGGIRWSTRKEDYRTEVLGLMKAQMTKNAVIVPTGSKGGFVLRTSPADPAEQREAVRTGYITFIRGLLDITDNLVDGQVVHPARVRVHDGPDPYLVVAADKGTATFSDTANEIADDYGFWLGDAFASGGSAGYDHKALGITARGAWESVKWHFREMGVDIMTQPFTVIGIGDMSGDVFGNGMQLSPTIKLVAAFDHRHIFLDPDPDTEASFAERRRLYGTPRSSWADYDASLISPGGGIHARTLKRIELTEQVRSLLRIDAHELTPDELIKAILQAPVDLLWNGGIGTYVKASTETNDQVGDRANDGLRIDGNQLRAKVVGEGGNLGLTQRARVEFALAGGRVYTDFIDNAGGVNCSDREVNLKILLGLAEARGELTRSERDRLVEDVVEDVVAAILYDNFLQAQILAQDAEMSGGDIEAFEDLMLVLESEGLLDRSIEQLPASDEMIERARLGQGMTTPELSVLLAYAKRSLTRWLLDSDLPDWADFAHVARDYFPGKVVERFEHLIDGHPLRRELVATVVANRVVNSEGVTFVSRLMTETGTTAPQVVRAYHIAREVTQAEQRWQAVEALVGRLPSGLVRKLMEGIDDLVETVSRWYLANPGKDLMGGVIAKARPAFAELTNTLPDAGHSQWRAERENEVRTWTELGVPEDIARHHVFQEELVHAPDIIEVANVTDRPVRQVADLFLLTGSAFEIDWLEDQVHGLPAVNRWQRRAIQTVQEDLVLLRRQLVERILSGAEGLDPHDALEHYLVNRTHELGRLTRFMRSLAGDGISDVAPVIVAIRQIRGLAA